MRIFIIEDSTEVRERLRDMLQRISHVELVGEAENENEAVRSIRNVQPDVVIVDFSLAIRNNQNVIRRIKMQSLATRVIVLSNNVYPQYRKKCMDLGADFFMDKSRDIGDLGSLLIELDDGKSTPASAK
jgi:DNA-binding NarL/FixJ family response regulator